MNQVQRFIISTPDLVLTFILQLSTEQLSKKGPFYSGMKVFNYLPTSIKNISHDIRKFIYVLKIFLLISSLYSLEEYFTWISNGDLNSV